MSGFHFFMFDGLKLNRLLYFKLPNLGYDYTVVCRLFNDGCNQ